MSPAKTQLKRLADRLSDEDAVLLVKIGRHLVRRKKAGIPVEELTAEEAAEVRRRLADTDDKPILFDQACREPTARHLPVARYVHPDEFAVLERAAREMGFAAVTSGPLVRSSYHAADMDLVRERYELARRNYARR